jgi:hypothetical protein
MFGRDSHVRELTVAAITCPFRQRPWRRNYPRVREKGQTRRAEVARVPVNSQACPAEERRYPRLRFGLV